jgi:tetratricopeptide (TPR) repeat protein
LLKGDNLLSLGLADRALEAFELAADVDSTSAVALAQAGTVYFNRGQHRVARRLYERALRMEPRRSGLHFALGVIAFQEGDIQEARREFEREIDVDPSSATSHVNLAMIYDEHLADPGRAAYHLERYIELTGGTQELREHLKRLRERLTSESD